MPANQRAALALTAEEAPLAQQVFPTSFKKSVIVPIPKNTHPASFNDYHLALTSEVMKCFKRPFIPLKPFICAFLSPNFDLL